MWIGFLHLMIVVLIYLVTTLPLNAKESSVCFRYLLKKSTSTEPGLFGIQVVDGKVMGRNGDPVVAAFDLDETFVRAIRSDDEARALRRDLSRKIVTIEVHGEKIHYEVLPGMVEALMYMERKGVRVTFFSAGDPERNRLLLKAIRVSGGREPLFRHVEGRLIDSSQIHFNFDPVSERPEVLKSLKTLGQQSASHMKNIRADFHNSFLLDDLKRTSLHQLWIPSFKEGGPPHDWKYRGQYIVGCFSAAVEEARRNPGMSLGAALKKVQTVNLLDPLQWESNALIRRGRLILRRR